MGNDLLPANPARNAHDFRTDTMGFLIVAQMGRSLGQMADKVSDGTFLWCDALLRRILCPASVRHCALHTGGKPDGNHGK